jgi:hypothetical protein
MPYEVSEETRDALDEIHERGKQLGRDGKAFDLEPNRRGRHIVIYWDEESEQWLHGTDAAETGWVMMPFDRFPKGLELIISWDEYEAVPVEETKLWHATYGLDQAREGYRL